MEMWRYITRLKRSRPRPLPLGPAAHVTEFGERHGSSLTSDHCVTPGSHAEAFWLDRLGLSVRLLVLHFMATTFFFQHLLMKLDKIVTWHLKKKAQREIWEALIRNFGANYQSGSWDSGPGQSVESDQEV